MRNCTSVAVGEGKTNLLTTDGEVVQLDKSPAGHIQGHLLSEPVELWCKEDTDNAAYWLLGVDRDDVLEGFMVQSTYHCLEQLITCCDTNQYQKYSVSSYTTHATIWRHILSQRSVT